MNCVVPQFNVKVFEKLWILLMKLSPHVQIEVDGHVIHLVAVNPSHSVFLSASLHPDFFSSSSPTRGGKYGIASKTLMILVKSLRHSEDGLVRMSVNPFELSFLVESPGSSKLLEFSLSDSDRIPPQPDLEESLVSFCVSCRLLCQALSSFDSHTNEITMLCSSLHVVLRNNSGSLQTEVILRTGDFAEYAWGGREETVTLNLSHLKHVLWFGEMFNQSLSVEVAGEGRPVRVALRSEGMLEIVCLLSTVRGDVAPLFMNWSQDTVWGQEGNVLVSDSADSADGFINA